MKSFVLTVAVLPALILSAPAMAQSPKMTAVPYTLEAKDAAVSCAGGKLVWPVAFTFPAGMTLQRPVPPTSSGAGEPIVVSGSERRAPLSPVSLSNDYSLNFDVLTNGRLTNIRPLNSGLHLVNNDFLTAWAAGWNFGPQEKVLTGCKMTWTVKTDHAPEMARAATYEAISLRNYPAGLPRTDPRTPDCKAADGRIRLKAYPDARRLSRTPGRPQWLVARYEVMGNGKVKSGGRLRASGDVTNLDAVNKALDQRAYYPGEAAAECLTSFVIPAEALPLEAKVDLADLMALNKDKGGDISAETTCPTEARRQIVNFNYRPEYYPTQANRLGIEGVAMLTFDVAPWGQIKLKSSWSHPLPQFAQAAGRMLTQTTGKASERGLSGCRLMVRFVRETDATNEAEAPETDSDEAGS